MAKIKKLTVKILLDIVMCLALVLLYKAKVLTLTYHEVVGIAILAVFLIHVLLNRTWVINVGKKLFSPQTPTRTKFSYWMTILLVISFLIIVISGVFFSKVLFKNLFGPDYEPSRIWRTLHLFFSAVSLILVGIHVGLYWDMVKAFFRKYITLPPVTTKVVCYVFLAIIVVWGAISIPQTGMTNWLTGQSNHSHGNKGAATQPAADGATGDQATLPEGAADDANASDERSERENRDAADGDSATNGERSGHGNRGDASGDANEGPAEERDGAPANADAAASERSGHGEQAAEGQATEAAASGRSGNHGANVTLSNTLLVISQFTCIIGLFAAITYWIDRLIKRSKKAKKAANKAAQDSSKA